MPFQLDSVAAPWVVIAMEGDPRIATRLAALPEHGVVAVLDGREMVTEAALFREFSTRLGFPSYFGHNWDALVDCLSDPHGLWHPGDLAVVIIRHSETLFDVEFFPLLVSVLCQAAERSNSSVDLDGDPLDRPATRLHFVLDADRDVTAVGGVLAKALDEDRAVRTEQGLVVVD